MKRPLKIQSRNLRWMIDSAAFLKRRSVGCVFFHCLLPTCPGDFHDIIGATEAFDASNRKGKGEYV